jgi:hypothetical protein
MAREVNLPIIVSGTIAAGLLKVSAVDGAAFLDPTTDAAASAAFLAAVRHNDCIEITAGGKKIRGFAKAAGSSATLDSEVSTGTLTKYAFYKITATEVNHFGTGLEADEYFMSAGTETCDANNKVRKCLTPDTTGVTITNSPGGTTYNMGLRDSAFADSQSGYTYRIISSTRYSKLILDQAVTSGTLHIATKNGEAMFFHDSIDFSGYAGGGYQFVFRDSAGVIATAFSGDVGGGEASTDILAGWNFTSGWIITNATINDANTFTVNAQYGSITSVVSVLDSIIKLVYEGTDSAGTSYMGTSSSSVLSLKAINATPIYVTGIANVVNLKNRVSAGTTDVTTLQALKLTDISSTGLHLVSTKGGATRNMMLVNSGFNPNTVTSVKVYRAY